MACHWIKLIGMFGDFTCSHCGATFAKARSDEEAMAEALTNFSPDEMNEGAAIVCDDCFQMFMGWMRTTASTREN